MTKEELMRKAIALSKESVERGGGPFGAVIAKDGKIIATGSNKVTILNDPTAHAEVCAIREACSALSNFKLDDCQIYSSCEPCPMCLAAIYWAGIDRLYFANTREDAKSIGFDDSFIYDEISLSPDKREVECKEMLRDEALEAFKMWNEKADKIEY